MHDVNVDLVRRLISTALGLLIRRLCSAASLDAADGNLAIHERGLENIRVGETAELQKTASDMHKVKIPAQPRTVTGNHKRLPSAVRMCSPVGEWLQVNTGSASLLWSLKRVLARDRVRVPLDVPAPAFPRPCHGRACRSWRRDPRGGLAQ